MITPSNIFDKSVTWSSSDPTVATVDSSGTVTAIKVGTATIRVTTNDNGHIATCIVTVIPSTYTVTPSTLTFTGGTGDLTFKVNEPAMSELQSVAVDGVTLNTSNYIVTAGSTVITLKNNWLINQPNGTYALTANFVNGKAGITLIVNQSSTSSGSGTSSGSTSSSGTASSNTPAGTSGGTLLPGGGSINGNTNTSKDFWYPNSSGSSSFASSNTSVNIGNDTSPNSPNYNPVTGGEVGGVSALVGFFLLATLGSVSMYMSRYKK